MKTIITISREFASGGREIGKKVAEELGYKYYDKELLQLIAQKEGYDVNFLEEMGEYKTDSLIYNLSTMGLYGAPSALGGGMSASDKIYVLQANLIKKIAETEPCVIVGRAADYILKDNPNCLNVFIYSDFESRRIRAEKLLKTDKNIEKILKKKDKSRANHYRHYTDRVWGVAKNYDISLNSGKIGFDKCAEIIVDVAKI